MSVFYGPVQTNVRVIFCDIKIKGLQRNRCKPDFYLADETAKETEEVKVTECAVAKAEDKVEVV